MNILANLSVLALRQAAEMAGVKEGADAAGSVVRLLAERFTDHSRKLDAALRKANEKAWKGLETALAGPSLFGRLTDLGRRQGVSHKVGAFLAALPPAELPGTDPPLPQGVPGAAEKGRSRPACSARASSTRRTWPSRPAPWPRSATRRRRLDAEWGRGSTRSPATLRAASYPTLAAFLLLRARRGAVGPRHRRPLFLPPRRREGRRTVPGARLRQDRALGDRQEQGFAALGATARGAGRAARRDAGRGAGAVARTKPARRPPRPPWPSCNNSARRWPPSQGEESPKTVDRPATACRSATTASRQRVKEFLARSAPCPRTVQNCDPAVLNALGKLEVAIGDLRDRAGRDFAADRRRQRGRPARKAEAHDNAYRAALERDDWDDALAGTPRGVAGSTRALRPVPARQVPAAADPRPGGFGVAFLCRHASQGRRSSSRASAATGSTRRRRRGLRRGPGPARTSTTRPSSACATAATPTPTTRGPSSSWTSSTARRSRRSRQQHGRISAADCPAPGPARRRGVARRPRQGSSHRDVKPANLLVRKRPARGVAGEVDRLRPRPAASAATTAHARSRPATPGSGEHRRHARLRRPGADGPAGDGPVGPHVRRLRLRPACCFALFGTPHPDDDDKDGLPEGWKALCACTATKVAKRLPNFAEVLEQLDQIPSEDRKRKQREDAEEPEQQERERLRLRQEREARTPPTEG